jgi:hypothetical protein
LSGDALALERGALLRASLKPLGVPLMLVLRLEGWSDGVVSLKQMVKAL